MYEDSSLRGEAAVSFLCIERKTESQEDQDCKLNDLALAPGMSAFVA